MTSSNLLMYLFSYARTTSDVFTRIARVRVVVLCRVASCPKTLDVIRSRVDFLNLPLLSSSAKLTHSSTQRNKNKSCYFCAEKRF